MNVETKLVRRAIISVWIFMIVSMIWMTGLTVFMFHELNDGPETVVSCTSAPDDSGDANVSIPTTEEIIHTETTASTEPTTEPTTEPIGEMTGELKPIEYVTEPSIKIEETEPVTVPTEPKEPETTKETTPPKKEEPVKNTTMSDREMLACVIYQETGSDSICDECRRRVADIVLNRVADSRFPNTIYKVLTAKNQYGRFSKTGIVWPSRAKKSVEKHAVERAYRIADEVLSGKHSNLYGKGYVWQASFKQGKSGFWCCGHYFAK